MPGCVPTLDSVGVVTLTILVGAGDCKCSGVLVTRGGRRGTNFVSTISLVMGVVLNLNLTGVLGIRCSCVAVTVLITCVVSSFLVTCRNSAVLEERGDLDCALGRFFPVEVFVPCVVTLVVSYARVRCLVFVPLLMFVVLGCGSLRFLGGVTLGLVGRPRMVSI